MMNEIRINGRRVGPGRPVYVVAELSANHGGDFSRAVKILKAAKAAGADAVKLQTYTADTMTLRGAGKFFRIGGGTLWDGRTLHDLYGEAFTPWDWHPKLKKIGNALGLDVFSSPFDGTSVDFLEKLDVPVYKVASFEIVDMPLIRRVAATGRPVIMSTGMATEAEIREAVDAFRRAGGRELALLKCTSAYPAPPEEMNLRTIPRLAETFRVPVGVSDHTLGIAVPAVAVALGACIVEKHITLSRADGGPDGAFSLEPGEFKAMVHAVRTAEKALGTARLGAGKADAKSLVFRRSLFVAEDMKAGEIFTSANVRAVRPGHGLHTRHLEEVLGRSARRRIRAGTPLSWLLVSGRPGRSFKRSRS